MKSRTAKVLHTLAGKPLLQYAVEAARASGAADVVAVVRYQRDAVVAALQHFAPDVHVADQDEIPGTGRAVQCGLEQLLRIAAPSTVLVTSADVPLLRGETLRDLLHAHETSENLVTVVTTAVEDPTGYGRIVRDPNSGAVRGIVEERDATNEQRRIREINAGIYAFNTEFLNRTLPQLGQDNDQGEIYLTDTVKIAGEGAGAFVLDDTWQARGCNDPQQLADLETEYLRRGGLAGEKTSQQPTNTSDNEQETP